jgi:hypothetical protein
LIEADHYLPMLTGPFTKILRNGICGSTRHPVYDPFILCVAETIHESRNFSTLLLAILNARLDANTLMRKHTMWYSASDNERGGT